jgi:hypothetical protein
VPASYDSRLFTIAPTATGYETRMAPGGDQKIGLNMLIIGVFGAVIGLFLSNVVRAVVVGVGILLVVFGVAALIQSTRSKVRALTVLDRKAGTVTQGSTVLPVADITGIGLIPIRSFHVVAVHRREAKPLWLSSAAKMPRHDELNAAVAAMAKAMGVPHTE